MGIKLTPKKVALAIGVSESSMKRWCDRGLIDFNKTAGGHRRISQSSIISFLRNSDHAILQAELLGLPQGTTRSDRPIDETALEFKQALVDGREDDCRRMVLGLYLAGHSIAELGDRLISPIFFEIGKQWECKEIEIYRERRACEIVVRLLHEIGTLISKPKETAPLAIGGAAQNDDYAVPTTLIELVLREMGWRSQSLGSKLPFSTLADAARQQRPRLFWLSVSHIDNELHFLHEYDQFRRVLSPETLLVVGGRALVEPVRSRMQYSAFGENLQQLQSLAGTIKTASFTGGNGHSQMNAAIQPSASV